MAAGFQFADMELDLQRCELRRAGMPIRLEKMPMALLISLLEAEGQLVTRREIIDRLWGPDVFVDTEHGINTAVRKLRVALGDDHENPRFVLTVVGRGYRFIEPIEVIAEAGVSDGGFIRKMVPSRTANGAGPWPTNSRQFVPGDWLNSEIHPQQRREPGSTAFWIRKPLVIPVMLALGTLIVAAGLEFRHTAKVHWAREQAVLEIAGLAAKGEYHGHSRWRRK